MRGGRKADFCTTSSFYELHEFYTITFGLASIVIITIAWIGFNTNPTVTRLQDTLYPSKLVYFPAVTICDVNRISLSAARSFALELAVKDTSNRSADFFLEKLKLLSSLHDFDISRDDELREFQNIIDRHFGVKPTDVGSNHSARLMEQLSPKCNERFIRCMWRSKLYNCTGTTGLFRKRRSAMYGYCCSFNYAANPNNVVDRPLDAKFTGPEMGLILLLNGSMDDTFLPLKMRNGFSVMVHHPYEYPQPVSGNLREVPVSIGRETFVRVDATNIQSDTSIIGYSLKERKCRFNRELADELGGVYTRSQCIVRCAVKSTMALCACVLYTLPMDLIQTGQNQSFKTCDLHDVACLQRYNIKWMTVSSEVLDQPGLEREREESLYCPQCLPSCTDTKYKAWAASLPLHRSLRQGANIMANIDNVTQVGLLRIYFGQPSTWLFKQDVQLEWFELLSNFGGICGVLLGFSLISATEIIYFVIKEIFTYLNRKRMVGNNVKLGDLVLVP